MTVKIIYMEMQRTIILYTKLYRVVDTHTHTHNILSDRENYEVMVVGRCIHIYLLFTLIELGKQILMLEMNELTRASVRTVVVDQITNISRVSIEYGIAFPKHTQTKRK